MLMGYKNMSDHMSKPLSFRQELVGAMGDPIDENPTQPMIEAAFRHHGLNWRYLTLLVGRDDLAAAVAGARAMNFRGFNCTIPHKVAVIDHLDGLGQSAALMGAVNCVVTRDGLLIGENTDGKGFVETVKRRREIDNCRAAIFGAGGAARAIAVELALAGAKQIIIVNRSTERGQTVTDLINSTVRELAPNVAALFVPLSENFEIPQHVDLVINATSIGLYPDLDAIPSIDLDSLTPNMLVADVIPNPPNTRFLQAAKKRGCEVIDGLEMLVAQGALGIHYWTGTTPETAIMRQALEKIFGQP